MNLKHFFMMLFCLSMTLIACNKEEDHTPVACFTISPNPVAAGATVSFTTCAENAHHYEWDFGDTATSALENPTHVYNTPGTYTVLQHVFNEDMSETDMTSNTIVVN